jgi:hypothetical protein
MEFIWIPRWPQAKKLELWYFLWYRLSDCLTYHILQLNIILLEFWLIILQSLIWPRPICMAWWSRCLGPTVYLWMRRDSRRWKHVIRICKQSIRELLIRIWYTWSVGRWEFILRKTSTFVLPRIVLRMRAKYESAHISVEWYGIRIRICSDPQTSLFILIHTSEASTVKNIFLWPRSLKQAAIITTRGVHRLPIFIQHYLRAKSPGKANWRWLIIWSPVFSQLI